MTTNKRLQTLIMNVDIFFKYFLNFVVNIFSVHANAWLSSFVSLQLFDKAFSTFQVGFIKKINVDKITQKRLLKNFLWTFQTFTTSICYKLRVLINWPVWLLVCHAARALLCYCYCRSRDCGHPASDWLSSTAFRPMALPAATNIENYSWKQINNNWKFRCIKCHCKKAYITKSKSWVFYLSAFYLFRTTWINNKYM